MTTQNPIRHLSPIQARESTEALLLDVRTPAEYEDAHIEGSVLHPLTSLSPDEVTQLAANRTTCILICGSGIRARQAAEKLRTTASLPSLAVLEGGIQAWDTAGLPLRRGRKTIPLERQVRIAAGLLVLSGALLGWFVSPAWIALSAFVGAGLIFAGITDICGMGLLLARMPWNTRGC